MYSFSPSYIVVIKRTLNCVDLGTDQPWQSVFLSFLFIPLRIHYTAREEQANPVTA